MAETNSSAPTTRTSRHHRCDYEFLGLLNEDFGIDFYSLNKALMGVPPAPKRQAISLCEWAVKAAKGDVDEAGKALRTWAQKHGVGLYDRRIVEAPPLTWEQTEHERRIREGARACVRDIGLAGAAATSGRLSGTPQPLNGAVPTRCMTCLRCGVGWEVGSPSTGTAPSTTPRWAAALAGLADTRDGGSA